MNPATDYISQRRNVMKFSTEYGSIELNFEPSKYKTPAGAAKAFYKALLELQKGWGNSEEYARKETLLLTPERSEALGYGRCWRVMWESGPFEWAIPASFEAHGSGWYTEPYYSFDLGFYEN
jgi:hypothetical protein